ncbi:MAG: hypothetical protein Q4C98_05445 [Capnocytophaga sp.]|nr:hypothetical protein [Capnocytophaga sp.]
MKHFFKFVGIIGLTLFTLACSKNDDPADNDIFVGTYKGNVTYVKDQTTLETDKVTVVKTGNSYYFQFGNSIPDLTGVEIQKGDNTALSVDFEDGVKGIKITASSLWMLYTKDGATWTVLNATR